MTSSNLQDSSSDTQVAEVRKLKFVVDRKILEKHGAAMNIDFTVTEKAVRSLGTAYESMRAITKAFEPMWAVQEAMNNMMSSQAALTMAFNNDAFVGLESLRQTKATILDPVESLKKSLNIGLQVDTVTSLSKAFIPPVFPSVAKAVDFGVIMERPKDLDKVMSNMARFSKVHKVNKQVSQLMQINENIAAKFDKIPKTVEGPSLRQKQQTGADTSDLTGIRHVEKEVVSSSEALSSDLSKRRNCDYSGKNDAKPAVTGVDCIVSHGFTWHLLINDSTRKIRMIQYVAATNKGVNTNSSINYLRMPDGRLENISKKMPDKAYQKLQLASSLLAIDHEAACVNLRACLDFVAQEIYKGHHQTDYAGRGLRDLLICVAKFDNTFKEELDRLIGLKTFGDSAAHSTQQISSAEALICLEYLERFMLKLYGEEEIMLKKLGTKVQNGAQKYKK